MLMFQKSALISFSVSQFLVSSFEIRRYDGVYLICAQDPLFDKLLPCALRKSVSVGANIKLKIYIFAISICFHTLVLCEWGKRNRTKYFYLRFQKCRFVTKNRLSNFVE